ncbi:hypothetical protein ACN38_g7019 [Penicillium nordicum]|uniref:Uncharacterized protein n=1 Tax=Penicillium nordicum TaxID=229535 RepID=A0A0M9WEV1_9EURO|nr:hypothetical protein ACN38_g7019 [Penicillium nordicum]
MRGDIYIVGQFSDEGPKEFEVNNLRRFYASCQTRSSTLFYTPRVEHCMGFPFGYRHPHGTRAEWLAVAGITHPEERSRMRQLVEKSPELICTLPCLGGARGEQW